MYQNNRERYWEYDDSDPEPVDIKAHNIALSMNEFGTEGSRWETRSVDSGEEPIVFFEEPQYDGLSQEKDDAEEQGDEQNAAVNDMLRNLILQKLNKLREEEQRDQNLLKVLLEQNEMLEQLKAQVINYYDDSEAYLEVRLKELRKLVKFKAKKERELRANKLECFVYNLSQMIMINPELAYDPQVATVIGEAKEELFKIEKKINIAKKYEDDSDYSLSDEDANESLFSNDEDREEYMALKKEMNQKRKDDYERELLEAEKARILQEVKMAQKEEFKVPEGMMLISEKDYKTQLDDLKVNTEKFMKEEMERLLKEKEEEFAKEKQRVKAKQERMRRLKIRLRGYAWYLTIPPMLMRISKMQKSQLRENKLQSYTDNLPSIIDNSVNVLRNVIMKNCKTLWEEKRSFNILTSNETCAFYKERPVMPKDIDKNIEVIEDYVRKLLRGLNEMCSEEILGQTLIAFLCDLTSNGNILPQSFLTQYEINRLEFDSDGGLLNMNKDRMKLLVIFYLIFYIFLKRVLTKPWTSDSSIKETPHRRLFMRTIGSIIYHSFMDYIKNRIKPDENAQTNLVVEKRTQPRQEQHIFLDERMKETLKEDFKEDKLVADVFSKTELKIVFMDKIAKFEKITPLVENFLEKICDILDRAKGDANKQVYEKKKAEITKEKAKILKVLKRIDPNIKIKAQNGSMSTLKEMANDKRLSIIPESSPEDMQNTRAEGRLSKFANKGTGLGTFSDSEEDSESNNKPK